MRIYLFVLVALIFGFSAEGGQLYSFENVELGLLSLFNVDMKLGNYTFICNASVQVVTPSFKAIYSDAADAFLIL
jgi:hypothetical protein